MRKTAIITLFFMMFALFGTAAADDSQETVSTGAYFKFGRYAGNDLLWRLVDVDSNGALLLSDTVFAPRAFDAPGTAQTGSHKATRGKKRNEKGSNYWADSNIRTWLNSTAQDFSNITWDCGIAPNGNYGYSSEGGFLRGFYASEISLIKTVTQDTLLDGCEYSDMTPYGSAAHLNKTAIGEVMANYSEAYKTSVTDRVFLPDIKQLLGAKSQVGNYIWSSSAYWLRTPRANNNTNSSKVRYVHTDRVISDDFAYSSNSIGVRPAFYISESAVITGGTGAKDDPYTVTAPIGFTGDVIASANIPAYDGNAKSGYVISVIRSAQGKIKKIYMTNIQLNPSTPTPVSVTLEGAYIVQGDKFDIYAWDGAMKPSIGDEHFEFTSSGGALQITRINSSES